MSAYKNGDTASWDASQVRRSQAGHTGRSQGNPSQQPQRRRRQRRRPFFYERKEAHSCPAIESAASMKRSSGS